MGEVFDDVVTFLTTRTVVDSVEDIIHRMRVTMNQKSFTTSMIHLFPKWTRTVSKREQLIYYSIESVQIGV